jgi:hypothetical protein
MSMRVVALARTDQQLITSVIIAALGANTVTPARRSPPYRGSREDATSDREPEGGGIAAGQIVQHPATQGPAALPIIAANITVRKILPKLGPPKLSAGIALITEVRL